MKIKDKSSIPEYLLFHDKGYMYFPESSLIPFFRKFDGLLKQMVNDDGFRKHGEKLIKVKLQYSCPSLPPKHTEKPLISAGTMLCVYVMT